MAVSKLMANGLNRTAVNNSLVALKNYAVEDKGMKVRHSVHDMASLTSVRGVGEGENASA